MAATSSCISSTCLVKSSFIARSRLICEVIHVRMVKNSINDNKASVFFQPLHCVTQLGICHNLVTEIHAHACSEGNHRETQTQLFSSVLLLLLRQTLLQLLHVLPLRCRQSVQGCRPRIQHLLLLFQFLDLDLETRCTLV